MPGGAASRVVWRGARAVAVALSLAVACAVPGFAAPDAPKAPEMPAAQRRVQPSPVQLSYGAVLRLIPSTNIRNVASDEVWHTPLGIVRIPGGGAPEVGLGAEIGGWAEASYRLDPQRRLSAALRLTRHLSPEASHRHWDSDLRLRYSYQGAGHSHFVTLSRRALRYDDSPPAPSWDSVGLGLTLGAALPLGRQGRIKARLSHEYRRHRARAYRDGPLTGLDLSYQRRLGQSSRSIGWVGEAGLHLGSYAPAAQHLAYDRARLSLGLTRVGAQAHWSLALEAGESHYRADIPGTGITRRDRDLVARLGLSLARVEIWGNRPRLECRAERRLSNVPLYRREGTTCGLSLAYTF